LRIFALCLIGLFLFQTKASAKTVKASWYDSKSECWRNPEQHCPMANGESIYKAERQGKLFAAMWGVPFGKKVEVKNVKTGKKVIVEIKDRGPGKSLGGGIDLCRKAFAQIEDLRQGVIVVEIRVL